MAKKKSYNPFKLFGSYVGAVIFGYYGWSSLVYFRFDFFDVLLKLNISQNVFKIFLNVPGAIFIHSVIGFLIGWGIHSLFRRFCK